MNTGSTAKLIVDALLQRFLPLARRRIDIFQAQNGQCLTPYDPAYEHVLESLAMVARHTPVPLLEALFHWRESESPKDANDAITFQNKLSVECIFSSACIRFVECSPQEGISEKLWSCLENFVFFWLINADRVVSQVEYPSLADLRGLLLDRVAQLLGALSRIRFNSVTDRFFIELNIRYVDSGNARSETLSIIHGMRYLKLEVKTEGGLNASASFVSKINPLNHPARRKRSELRHALCNMLSSILAPLADGGKNIWPLLGVNTALALWYEAVGRIRLQLINWMDKQSKHISVGFPLVTLLLCLGDPQTFIDNLASHMEHLCKQLKDKSHRSMVLDCLHRTVRFYLSVYADQPRNNVSDCLDDVTSHLLNSFKRGLLIQDIQHDELVDVCITVAKNNLDFAMNHLLLELLKPDGSNEAKVIGLRAMLAIVISSNKRGLEIFNDHDLGHYISMVSYAIDSILRDCSKSFSHALLTSSKTTIDNASKEKSQRLLFISVLKCIPFLLEEGCQNDKITEIILQHGISIDPEVRKEAVQAMNRIVRYLPQCRYAIMRGMVNFILNLPDEFPHLIQTSLGRLVELMHLWSGSLTEEMPIGYNQIPNMLDQKFPFSQSGDAYEFCTSEMDALGLIFLTSEEVRIRHAAFEFLHRVRLLKNDLIEFSRKDSFGDKLKFEDDPILIIDVLEENGDDIVQGCYRDAGRFYFLRPEFDTVHLDVTIQSIIESPHKITWAKCLGELVRYSGDLCAKAVHEARLEVVKRLAHVTPIELGGKAHQSNDVDSKVEQWLMYAIFVCSCPPDNNGDGHISTAKKLFQLIFPSLKHGSEAHAHAASVALGYTHLELSEVMFGELASFVKEVSSDVEGKTKSKNQKFRHEELHVHIANVHRAVAEKIWPGMLSQKPMLCSHFIKFIDETCRQLSYSPFDSFQGLQPRRFALASVVRHLAPELVDSKHVNFDTRTRKRLFDLLLTWCDESESTTKNNNSGHPRELDRHKFSQHIRSRESVDKRLSDSDMVEQVETIQWASMNAIASLLYGPCFDVNVKKLSGRVISWINSLFMDVASKDLPTDSLAPNLLKDIGTKRVSVGLDKHNASIHLRVHIAKSALKNLLRTNLDLFPACIDQCYSPESSISDSYFIVLSEVYLHHEIPSCKIHKILSLILYKVVDPSRQIRDYALKMLETLSYREWTEDGTDGAGYQASVVGNLPDSCQQFQYTLSAKLAKDHPELSELLCEELMQRQLDAVDIIAQHKVLTCMAPWIGNLNFLKLKDSRWSERLLKSLYYVTWKHGDQFPDELEKLWSTIGSNNRNIIPVLDFLVAKGIEECVSNTSSTYFAVAKRVSLYLARICPQQTIDHLVCQLSQRILEDVIKPMVSNRGDACANCVLQFSQGSSAVEIATDLDNQPSMPSLLARLSFDAPHRNISWGTSAVSHHSVSGPLSSLPQDVYMVTTTSRSGQLLPALKNLSGPLVGSNTSGNLCSHDVSRDSGDTLNSSSGSGVSPRQLQLALMQGHNQHQLSRADIALCLLAEVAYENDEDFRDHLPLLFHITCISMDSSEDIVLEHCQHLLVNLLYSLAGRHVELYGEENGEGENNKKVASLIKYIQSKRGTAMWENADPTLLKPVPSSASLLSALVLGIVDAILVQGDLRETWGTEALKWAIECTSRHLACRSHQVYRALKSTVRSDTCVLLLRCLLKCLSNPVPEILGFAMEILMTLQVIVENMEPEKVIMYPQLFWASVALMHTDYIHIYCKVLELFCKIVDRLSFRLLAVENVLLSSKPRYEELESKNGKAPAFEGVQPLVLKGLTSAVSHGYAVEVLSCIAIPFCDSVFGDRETRLLMHITGFLPWLGLQVPNGPAVTKACSVASKISSWCLTKSLCDLAQVFESYSRGEITKSNDLFALVSPLICAEWFPKHSCLAFGHLLKLLERGPAYYQQVILLLLKALLQQSPVDAAQSLRVHAVVSLFMEGPLWSDALSVLEALLQSCSTRNGSHHDETLGLGAICNESGLVENTPQGLSGGALTGGGIGGVSDGGLTESETSIRNTQVMLGCVIDNCALGRKQSYKHLVPFVARIGNE